jgi:hypothetical protein
MPYSDGQIDASFYRLIHQLVSAQEEDEPVERRAAERHTFSATERIAPYRGGRFPDEGEFVEVRCHDLSQTGFSFFLPAPPDFKSLVVAFGTPPELIYAVAEVMRFSRVLLHPSGLLEEVGDPPEGASSRLSHGHTGRPMVLVGCRLVKRLEKPAARGDQKPARPDA